MTDQKPKRDQTRIWFVCSQKFLSRANYVADQKGITTAEYARSLVWRDMDDFEHIHGAIPEEPVILD